jgi:hypothetical protein
MVADAETYMIGTSLGCRHWLLTLMAASALGSATAHVHAQDVGITESDPRLIPAGHKTESVERFILEFRGGPSSPAVTRNSAYGDFFSSDIGPNLGIEVDGVVYREPRWFYVTVGGSVGILNFSGNALETLTGATVGEKTTLSIIPLTAVGSFRFDALARRFHIPLVLTARLGWEWAHWNTGTGSRTDATGWSVGPVFSGQVAIDLDTFEPNGARNLDEEWGINHTYLFGEIYHFAPVAKSLDLADTSWLLGLGFVF